MEAWIEVSTGAEYAESPDWPYRMVFENGQRFGLSVADGVRAQKNGVPFRPMRQPQDALDLEILDTREGYKLAE